MFASLALAYCFTNLPLDLKHNRLPICLAAASGCLLLLLLACWSFVGGRWLGGSVAIAAASLALPWGFWAIWWFYGRHVFPLCLAWFSAWVFGLLAVIRAFTGGAWLLGFAYPIAAFCLFYLWLLFALLYWLPCGPWLKGGLSTLLLAFAIPFGNWLFNWMVPTQNVPALSDYFAWDRLLTHENIHGSSWINILVFVLMLICSAVLLCVGSVLEVRRRRKS